MNRVMIAIVTATALPLLVGCVDNRSRTAEFDTAVVPIVFWSEDDGTPVDDKTFDETPMSKNLVSSGELAPLFDTDGERLTWGEARTPKGRVSLMCGDDETEIHIDASGLRPGGTYTAWLAFFKAPGFPEAGLNAITAISPVGPPDGSQSVLFVDEEGRAELVARVPPGIATVELGAKQLIPECLLDTYELHVVLAYHLDGKICGDNPCDEDRFIEHSAWIITQENTVMAAK